ATSSARSASSSTTSARFPISLSLIAGCAAVAIFLRPILEYCRHRAVKLPEEARGCELKSHLAIKSQLNHVLDYLGTETATRRNTDRRTAALLPTHEESPLTTLASIYLPTDMDPTLAPRKGAVLNSVCRQLMHSHSNRLCRRSSNKDRYAVN